MYASICRETALPFPAPKSATFNNLYSDPKSFVNFLLPPRTRGEGWGGVKNLRLLQGLLYKIEDCTKTFV